MEVFVLNFDVTSRIENEVNDAQLNLYLRQSMDPRTEARLSRKEERKKLRGVRGKNIELVY